MPTVIPSPEMLKAAFRPFGCGKPAGAGILDGAKVAHCHQWRRKSKRNSLVRCEVICPVRPTIKYRGARGRCARALGVPDASPDNKPPISTCTGAENWVLPYR